MVIQGGKGHRLVLLCILRGQNNRKLVSLVMGRRSFQDVPPNTSGSCWSTGKDWYNRNILFVQRHVRCLRNEDEQHLCGHQKRRREVKAVLLN